MTSEQGSKAVLKAEDLHHILSDRMALLPGSRDRNGCALIVFPSREQPTEFDATRQLLSYLLSVTEDAAREKGYVAVVDMRGKTTWTNVKPVLKALDSLAESVSFSQVFIIKPEKFLERQKIALNSWRFVVQLVSWESLLKFVDAAQLPREVGGALAYDHVEWLETRLQLEKWIWSISYAMDELESARRAMEAETARGSGTSSAAEAHKRHIQVKDKILDVKIEQIKNESVQISDRMRNPRRGAPNPDLTSSIRFMERLVSSLSQLKNDVYKRWEWRRQELDGIHQQAVLEHDTEKLCENASEKIALLERQMGSIGNSSGQAKQLTNDFESVVSAVANIEVNVSYVIDTAKRLRVNGQNKGTIDSSVIRLEERWHHLQELIKIRRQILQSAIPFFQAAENYFEKFPTWDAAASQSRASIDASTASNSSDDVEEAFKQHHTFMNKIEDAYAVTVEQGNKLREALSKAGLENAAAVEVINRLRKYQSSIHDKCDINRRFLGHLVTKNALDADIQKVVTWLDDHGEPYIERNIAIGDNATYASKLKINHKKFQMIAMNTYDNMKRLRDVYEQLKASNLQDIDYARLNEAINSLDARVKHFKRKVDARADLLDKATLFFTHYTELTTWMRDLLERYQQRVVFVDVESCEQAKERFVAECDETAHAYAITITEGQQLVGALQTAAATYDIDYSHATGNAQGMIMEIERINNSVADKWSEQRVLLNVGLRFAQFLHSSKTILVEIKNWEGDMLKMLESEQFEANAKRVGPLHRENTEKVEQAIARIKINAKELNQAIHGQGLLELQTVDNRNVVEMVRDRVAKLGEAENHILEQARATTQMIEVACEIQQARHTARQIVAELDAEFATMHKAYAHIPKNRKEAEDALELIEQYEKHFQSKKLDMLEQFFMYMRVLFDKVHVSRRGVVSDIQEHVVGYLQRRNIIIEERKKLLKAAIGCHKTIDDNVVGILDQLAKSFDQRHVDWCSLCPSTSLEVKTHYIAEQMKKHIEYKDRLIKGCTYAQKTSDLYLKYIERDVNINEDDRHQHEKFIRSKKSMVRERQTEILDLWVKKKKELERCQHYTLLAFSVRKILDWLSREGDQRLVECTKRRTNAGGAEEYAQFKTAVKERRTETQTVLQMGAEMQAEGGQHAHDIESCLKELRHAFEAFSKRVADCEVAVRGGKSQNIKDELSLDRHSDNQMEDKIAYGIREENRRILEPMAELLASERVYVIDLKRCVEIYVAEFDKASVDGKLPESLKGMKEDIFGNIDLIYEFHRDKFLRELEKYETDPEAVGCSFTVWVDYLHMLYTKYCVTKDKNSQTLQQPDVSQFFGSIREKYNLEINNDLGSLLIKPVQRITRYRLMIEQLLKYCKANIDELKEAYELVVNIPKRANDLIHYNNLDQADLKKHDGVLGPFVMQDTLTVLDPKAYFKKAGSIRQVFLFELAILFTKKNLATGFYNIRGKPLWLTEVSIVEHVEGDPCRFGLRMGTVASNDNRTDLKAQSEHAKVQWVKKIRELTQGMLPLGLGMTNLNLAGAQQQSGSSLDGLSAGSISSRGFSTRTTASVSSGDRHSRDAETLSTGTNRHSIQSSDSQEQPLEQWIVSADFAAQHANHLSVKKGEKVEIIQEKNPPQSSEDDPAEWVYVVAVDDVNRQGFVPISILLPDQPSSSSSATDRPDASPATSVVKRKSLRRIFANSSNKEAKGDKDKDRRQSSPARQQSQLTTKELANEVPAASRVLSQASTSGSGSGLALASVGRGASTEAAGSQHSTPSQSNTIRNSLTQADAEREENLLPPEDDLNAASDTATAASQLPPPMEQLTLNNTHMPGDESSAMSSSLATADENNGTPVEGQNEELERNDVKETPEEAARTKRMYVLRELVETEKDYVRDLSSVVEGYIANLEKMELPTELQGKDKIIFANIAQILEFHKNTFLNEISKCEENYEAAGSAFVKCHRRLEGLYVKYCQNKPKSDYLVSQEDFEGFFAETKAKLGHKVALSDLLIKPVQRIMKYQLLLKDILKYTERAGDRLDVLKKALDVMHVVPKACDDMMQVGRLQNFDGNLSAQGKLIHQGTLSIAEVQAGAVQKAKDRRIFLFEQSAILADHIPPKKEFGNPIYIFKNQIMVNKMVFEPNLPDDPLKFTIKSSDPSQPISFLAIAQSKEEKDEWVRFLNEQLDQQKRLLAALVDPKRYMGGGSDDVTGGMGNMNIGGNRSPGPAGGGGRFGAGSAAPATPSGAKGATSSSAKPESPKKETKSKLFSFGKKSNTKSPTSPPPVGKLK